MSQETLERLIAGDSPCLSGSYEEEAIPERDPHYNGWIWDNHIPGTLNPYDEVTVVRSLEARAAQ